MHFMMVIYLCNAIESSNYIRLIMHFAIRIAATIFAHLSTLQKTVAEITVHLVIYFSFMPIVMGKEGSGSKLLIRIVMEMVS